MQGCARDVGQAEARALPSPRRQGRAPAPHGLFWLLEHPRRIPAAHLGARISSIWEGTLPASRNSGADQRRRWTKFLALEATTQFSSVRREWSHYRHFWYRGLLCGWPIGAWGRSSTLKVILEMGHGITSSVRTGGRVDEGAGRRRPPVSGSPRLYSKASSSWNSSSLIHSRSRRLPTRVGWRTPAHWSWLSAARAAVAVTP